MQYAILILDGASGDPVPEFDGLTTFEACETPHLDALAGSGTVGLMQNVPAHMESCSNVACMSIVGYDPAAFPIGRGAIEGAALGIDLEPGQVACRLNLCYVEDGIMKSYSTDNLATEDGHAFAHELAEELNDETFTLHPGTSFRQILVVEGHPELMDLVYECPHDNTNLDVTETFKPRVPAGVAGEAAARLQAAADLLIDYVQRANKVLAKSAINARRVSAGLPPANHVWAFWPGMKPDALASFSEVYGKTCAMNSAVDLLDGIAKLTDMRIYKVDGVTDGPNNDFAAQGRAGIHLLEEGSDVVVIHVEAPDAAGHDGRADEKKNAIERSDAEIVSLLRAYAAEHPLRVAVMPDHPTPLSTRKHSYDAVPFLVWGPGVSANGAKRLTEAVARATGVELDLGLTLLRDLLLAD